MKQKDQIRQQKVISILNQKGGCGKTTISVNLCHAFQIAGYKSLLVDSDPQGTARDSSEPFDGSNVQVIGLDRPSFKKDLNAIRDGYEIIMIDGTPGINNTLTEIIQCSDIILIPVLPSPYDISSSEALVILIKKRQEESKKKLLAFFVLNRAFKRTKILKSAAEALQRYEIPTLDSYVINRNIYPESAGQGKTIYNYKSNLEARLEINSIRDKVIEVLYDI